MSYHTNMNTGSPQPIFLQQTGSSTNQAPFNNVAGVQHPPAYLPPNQRPVQNAQLPQQQGSPYVHPAALGGQYPQNHQQYSQPPQQPHQQYGVAPQHMTVTQPQVYSANPQVVVAGCAQGQHYFTTQYGACGIIAAILLFPLGFICLFMDQERRCTRCGALG